MFLPREPRPGEKIDAAWGAAIVRYLRSITLQRGTDYALDRSPNGTRIQPRAVPAAAAAAAVPPHPFKVVAGATAGHVSITPGSVQSIEVLVPTLGGDSIASDPAPELEITSNGRIYLKVTVSLSGTSPAVTAAEIVWSTTVLANTATIAYLWLGGISNYVAGPPKTFTIYQFVSGSQAYQLCGTTHLFGLI
ncbi:hypothetical protein ASA1KI_21310 [Opitutales bacterium ASA1]|uniref:hypothetical protein n=1 Tax=Congregicoccus parvus TaxID=3081749 RepID=UPI002B295779|nr:hypothetical protein ASA1KI_21310 [Opitutales bacterium ASA1]